MRILPLLLLLLAACGRPPGGTPASSKTAAIPSVSVAKVVRNDLARDLELAAEFRPWQQVEVAAKINGYLRTIPVQVGDRLQLGQTIGLLEVPELDQERAQAAATEKRSALDVARAKSEVTRAESALKIRELSYERLAGVAKQRPNLIAQQEIDDAAAKLQESVSLLATARAALASVEEQVKVAQSGLARVDAMLSYTRVTAPFPGVVVERMADTGAMIQAGSKPLVRLAQVDPLRLVLPVPESIVDRVRIGSPVEIRVDSLATVVQGKVARFSGSLSTGTRTMETEVDVPNASYMLKPGMYAHATLLLEERGGVLAIPIQAVRAAGSSAADPRQNLAVVNAQSQIEMREVKLGLETPDQVEVVSGLKEGDLVVIGNRGELKPGQKVEPRVMGAK